MNEKIACPFCAKPIAIFSNYMQCHACDASFLASYNGQGFLASIFVISQPVKNLELENYKNR